MSDTTTETAPSEQQLAEAEQRGHLAGVQATSALWKADVELMNEIINAAADNADLCSSYEDTLDTVNARCSMIQLEGRARSYTVSISLTVDVDANASNIDDRAGEIAMALDGSYVAGVTVTSADVSDYFVN